MLKEDPLGEPLSGRERGEDGEREADGGGESEKPGWREGVAGQMRVKGKGRAGKEDGEERRAAAVKLHFILTDLLYTLISLLKKRKWHSIRRNPFLPEQACQPGDEWIQAELSSSGLAPSGTQQQQQ